MDNVSGVATFGFGYIVSVTSRSCESKIIAALFCVMAEQRVNSYLRVNFDKEKSLNKSTAEKTAIMINISVKRRENYRYLFISSATLIMRRTSIFVVRKITYALRVMCIECEQNGAER